MFYCRFEQLAQIWGFDQLVDDLHHLLHHHHQHHRSCRCLDNWLHSLLTHQPPPSLRHSKTQSEALAQVPGTYGGLGNFCFCARQGEVLPKFFNSSLATSPALGSSSSNFGSCCCCCKCSQLLETALKAETLSLLTCILVQVTDLLLAPVR